MTCYSPLVGWRSREVGKNGRRGVTFSARDGWIDVPAKVNCGQCIGCRLRRSREWAIRCVHEASLYQNNCFLTLTYDNEHLPGQLVKRDFQLFMKRLRKYIRPEKVRFFHCGEYGELNSRPHYHACLFGYDFKDKKLWQTKNNIQLYVSDILNSLWGKGYCIIGDVTFESAAYIARYIMKKVTGKMAEEHYKGKQPEYITMSLKPGIGAKWFEKYKTDVFPSDEVIIKGKEVTVPKYYDTLYERLDSEAMNQIKVSRIEEGKRLIRDNIPSRLVVKNKCAIARINLFKRSYENG